MNLLKSYIIFLLFFLISCTAYAESNLNKKLTHQTFDTHQLCQALRPAIHQAQKIAVYLEQMMSMGRSIPKEAVLKLKNSTLSNLEKENGALISSGSEIAYFRSVVDRLMQHLDQPFDYELYFLKNTKIDNAFAIPPNVLVITEPFLQNLSNEAQLAVVLAHELGHLYFNHSLALVAILNDMIDIDHAQLRLLVSLISKNLIHLLYGNQLEEQADAWGLELSYLAGYDIYSMNDFWFGLQKREIKEDQKNKQNTNQGNSYMSRLKSVGKTMAEYEMVQNGLDLVKTSVASANQILYQYISKEDLAYWKKLTIEKTTAGIDFIKETTQKLKPELEALLSSHPAHELRACIAREMDDQLKIILGQNQKILNPSKIKQLKH
jgi:Zn-dependent protease with chaperone function